MTTIEPTHVHEILKKHQLTDGMDIVLDLDQSNGAWVHDSRSGDKFLDCFTCFASWPLGYNHPALNAAADATCDRRHQRVRAPFIVQP